MASLLATVSRRPACFSRNCHFPSHYRFGPNSFFTRLNRRLPCIDYAWRKKQQFITSFKAVCHRRPGQDDLRIRWSGCLNFSWKFTSWIISFCLFCLNLVGEAHGDPALSFSRYACEDVSNYYASVEQKEGEALMKELNSVISSHHSLSYKKVWEALKILDAADADNPEASPDIVEIYTLRVVSNLSAGKPEGWNREHLWPRSYGVRSGPASTDLHNIRPADVNVNASRGKKYYGECINSTSCMKPATKEAAYDTETDNARWAPPSQVRGDIARALMYMAVRYGFNQKDESISLHLSDSPNMENREMGLLSTLLKWNELDPPSRVEQLRNNRVCKLYQHNRNPFVDHPEYANLIWRRAFPSIQNINSPPKAWINEFHYDNRGKDRNEFVEVVLAPSTNAEKLKLALYNGANGKIYWSLSLEDTGVFHITHAGSGFLIYTVFVLLQNGPADAIALVSSREDGHGDEVIQFLSYGGVVKATDGPAKGTESKDIGLRETEGSSENDSIGLTGAKIAEFKWRKFINQASPREPNVEQILSPS